MSGWVIVNAGCLLVSFVFWRLCRSQGSRFGEVANAFAMACNALSIALNLILWAAK